MSFCNLELSGNIGGEVKIKYTATGLPICNFSVAFNSGKSVAFNSGKKDDKFKNPTVWFNCICFKELAEKVAAEYKKGMLIKITKAFPKMNIWTDKEGQEQKRIEWIVMAIGEQKSALPTQTGPTVAEEDDIPF